MSDKSFTVVDFFRLAKDVAAQESELRIQEADAAAERQIRLAKAGVVDGMRTSASQAH